MTVEDLIILLLEQDLKAQVALPSDASNKMVVPLSKVEGASSYHTDWIEGHEYLSASSDNQLIEFVVLH